MQSDAWIKMMLHDGIFIIQCFIKWQNGECVYSKFGNVQWKFSTIIHDLLLLENQIPFFVLQDLLDLFVRHKKDDTVDNGNLPLLLLIYWGFIEQGELTKIGWRTIMNTDAGVIKHLLHLYHRWYTSTQYEYYPDPEPTGYMSHFLKKIALVPAIFQCVMTSILGICRRPRDTLGTRAETRASSSILPAAKLQEVGINFKKGRPANSLHVKFDKNSGDLAIPPLSLDENMMSRLASLIALERSVKDVPHVVIHYAAFMDKLIQTPQDVEILRREGILVNFQDDVDVAFFFNKLCRHSHLDVDDATLAEGHRLNRLFRDVDEYRNTCWHRNKALFVRKYCSSIWVFTGLVSGFVLLILTFLQTYFSIYAYYRPPSKS